MKEQRKQPIWLEPYWQTKREAIANRIRAAIASLQKKCISVSLSAICKEVKELNGRSISPNSVKRNQGAYDAYLIARPQARSVGSAGLKDLTSRLQGAQRGAMYAKIARLRRERKDSLIARLIAVEQHGAQRELVEQRLRDQIITLSLSSRKVT
ncbi:MAG: hypothetical protein WA419_18545 [Silvibacterium sp.]